MVMPTGILTRSSLSVDSTQTMIALLLLWFHTYTTQAVVIFIQNNEMESPKVTAQRVHACPASGM